MRNYCISLESREDRWKLARFEFNRQGLSVHKVSAIKANPGWVGCRDSHLNVLSFAKDNAGEMFCVFEDDVTFLDNFHNSLGKAMSQLPEHWDVLYLGSNLQSPVTRHSENLFKINEAWCAHAVIYNNREEGVVDYILQHRPEIRKFDVFLSKEVNNKFNCFVIYPMLCDQRVSPSDICELTDVSQIQKNYNKFINDAIEHSAI